MRNLADGLRIVVLESPYDAWKDPRVGDLFRDLVEFKLKGYGASYPYGVLPVDGADIISTHLTVCREMGSRLKPLMAIRWTSLAKARRHYMNFPGLSLLEQAGAQAHVAALEKIIKFNDVCGVDLYYCGSWSIDPGERGDKERSAFYRDLLTMMYVNYHQQLPPSALMAGGTLRFKIDDYMRWLGHVPLQNSNEGRELEPIHARHLAGETVHVMVLREFSPEARERAKKWEQLWERRLWIGAERSVSLNAQSPAESLRKAG